MPRRCDRRRELRARARPTFPLGVGLAAALGGILASSLFDYPPRTNVIMAAIMVEIGALIALERAARTTDDRRQTTGLGS